MRFSFCFVPVITSLMLAGCATPDERAVTALEKELGLHSAPYFPRCLSEEIAPRASVVAGQYSLGHTIDNPQGNVAIDRCVRWDINEPPGKFNDKAEKLILIPPKKTQLPGEETSKKWLTFSESKEN